LRPFRVAVQIDRDEQAGFLDELGSAEDLILDLMAGRAPRGTPVKEERFVLIESGFESRVHRAFVPLDTVSGHELRCCFACRLGLCLLVGVGLSGRRIRAAAAANNEGDAERSQGA
jgi:hypothetical protein